MDESVSKLAESESTAFDLGKLLGQRQAFSLVAGRCSAAEAECIRKFRDEGQYKLLEEDWAEFCPKFLGMSRSNADRIVRVLNECGPAYFALTQFTRISPEAYRTIAPAVTDQAIRLNGEAIELVSENAKRITAAVAELRKAAKVDAPAPPSTRDRLDALERRCQAVVAEFSHLAGSTPLCEEQSLLRDVLGRTRVELALIELEIHPAPVGR
jgi:hypothetical protein